MYKTVHEMGNALVQLSSGHPTPMDLKNYFLKNGRASRASGYGFVQEKYKEIGHAGHASINL